MIIISILVMMIYIMIYLHDIHHYSHRYAQAMNLSHVAGQEVEQQRQKLSAAEISLHRATHPKLAGGLEVSLGKHDPVVTIW